MFHLALLLSAHAHAQTVTVSNTGRSMAVDDSGTVVLDPSLAVQWQPQRRQGNPNIMSAATQVNVQLNVAQWIGHGGRIYMDLPSGTGPTVRASWTTGGRLLPGTLISGGRSLIYSGLITSPNLRDILQIKLEVDGRRLRQPAGLGFSFEIEVNP